MNKNIKGEQLNMLTLILCTIGVVIFANLAAWFAIALYKENKKLEQELKDAERANNNLRAYINMQDTAIDNLNNELRKSKIKS